MDFEALTGFAKEKRALSERIAGYKPGETGFENLTQSERFQRLWEQGMELLGADERHTGGIFTAFGQSEEGTGLVATIELRDRSPLGLGRFPENTRTIKVEWADASSGLGEPAEPIGDPQRVTGAEIAFCESDNPRVLRNLALLEKSFVAIDELLRQPNATQRTMLLATANA
jgi:hypothetical protein